MSTVTIRPVVLSDAANIARIYNHYVLNTVVSFEEQAIDANQMQQRIQEILDSRLPWLIAEQLTQVVGFAYASKWKGRCAYRNSAETTIYLDNKVVKQGIGSLLYATLIQQLRDTGLHTAIGGIALPNESSVALHKKLGFKKVAHFEQVGFKHHRWVDVGYWQLLL